jgi:hypothetical protein
VHIRCAINQGSDNFLEGHEMRKRLVRYLFAACCLLAGSAQCQAAVVSFGSGTNVFQMEFVTIGNPGNQSVIDPLTLNPVGSVGYTYAIGKFEVSENMIAKYNANFGFDNSMVIHIGSRGPNKPATRISWNAAARFVNWLNTSSGGFAAYKFTTSGIEADIALWDANDLEDYDPSNPLRSKRTRYVLPSFDEWYKAAYFDPIGNTYFDYPTSNGGYPTAVESGTDPNTAVYTSVYGQGPGDLNGPADVDQAGGLNAYKVMGLGGNVWEWTEDPSILQESSNSYHVILGGSYRMDGGAMYRGSFTDHEARTAFEHLGFRVASLSSSAPPAVPEPSMMVIGTLFGLGGLLAKRRMNK